MSSGAYIALSGLRSRADQLDRLAADLANAATSGYKSERGTTVAAERPADPFGRALQSAIDVAGGPRALDLRPGVVSPTGRDFDLAIDGAGFFAVSTPAGERYTRNGHFSRGADGTLVTEQGYTVLGASGPLVVPEGSGRLTVDADGVLKAGDAVVGRPRIVTFERDDVVGREDGALFRVRPGAVADANARVVNGALEGSNVSVVERMVQLTEVTRGFEALQRGVTILMNDLDGRIIADLGRR